MRVRGTADRLTRRLERDLLGPREQLGLRDVENRHGAEHHPLGLLALTLDVTAGLLRLSVADAHRSEDANGALALAHAAVQLKERPKASDVARVGALQGDQQLVVKRVAREAVARAHLHPALPSLRAEQRTRRPPESLTVGAAALGALGLGQLAMPHGSPSFACWHRPVRGRFPDPAHAQRAIVGRGVGPPQSSGAAGPAGSSTPPRARPRQCLPHALGFLLLVLRRRAAGRLAHGRAELLLGLAVGARLALQRALQLHVRGGQQLLGEPRERLARDVLARARQHRTPALARGQHELLGVVLRGEHDERPAVELTGALGALDEAPQPRNGVLHLAVGDLRLSGPAALQRRRRRRAVLFDHEANAVRGDRRDSVVATAEIAVPVGAQQAVGEEARDIQVGRVDGGELSQQRGAEVEVRPVRPGRQLADGSAVLGIELLLRSALVLALRPVARTLSLCALLRGAQLLERALDRLLGQLAVESAVGDDRRAVIELEQHTGGPCLVDFRLAEADRRWAIGVALDLRVQRLGLGVGGLDLLTQAQLGDVVGAERGQVGAERLAAVFAQGIADHPAGVARELLAADLSGGDRSHGRVAESRRHLGDLRQRRDRAHGQLAAADQLLGGLGQLEDLRPGAHELAAPAEHARGAVEGVALLEHVRYRVRLLQGGELLAHDVLGGAVGARALLLAQGDLDLVQAEAAARRVAVMPGHEGEALAVGANDERDYQSPERDRAGERIDVLAVELARVLAQVDRAEGDAIGRSGDCTHERTSICMAPPAAGPIPISRARRRRAIIGMGSARAALPPR